MSNIKAVEIEGTAPFDLFDDRDYAATTMSVDESAFIARLCFAPSTGLRLSWGNEHYVLNDRGGYTTMYRFSIKGSEAVSAAALERVKDIFERIGNVTRFNVIDLEA
jgi:hypothetical protein